MHQPDQVDELLEAWRRWLCSWLGHDVVTNPRGAPVVGPFKVCRRCGKWER